MNCKGFETDIKAWIDGELAAPRRVELSEHLAVCAACRAREGVLKAALAAVPPPHRVSAGFTRRIMESVSREHKEFPEVAGPWWSVVFGYRPMLRAAALATLALVLITGAMIAVRRSRHGAGAVADGRVNPAQDRCLAVRCRAI